MDSIALRGIRLQTRIGVPEKERASPQELTVDVELFTSVRETAMSDSLSHGIDYAEVTKAIQAMAGTERKTVEKLAEDIGAMLIKEFKPQGGVKVTVWKKPADLEIEAACVTIQRP